MKKRIIIMMLISTILLTGCERKQIETQEPINEIEEKAHSKYESIEWNCSVPLDKIKDFNNSEDLFITNDGELYQASLYKIFSNEEKCIKVDTDLKFERIINGALITSNNKAYSYINNKFEENTQGWSGAIDYELFKNYPNMLLLMRIYKNSIDYNYFHYTIIEDKNLYEISNNKKELIGTLNDDENFISNNYFIIKTTKNYYYFGIINEEECEKYADKECVFGLKKDEEMSNQYDNIQYYNGKIIIFKDDQKHIYRKMI